MFLRPIHCSALMFVLLGQVTVYAQVYRFADDILERGYYDRPYERYEAEPDYCQTNATFLPASDNQRDLQSEASHQQALVLQSAQDSVSWVVERPGDGLTIRFSLPDSPEGTGLQGAVDVFAGAEKVGTIALDSRWAWQYCNQNYPQNEPLTGNVIIRMRFDETHLRLARTVNTAEVLTLRKAANDELPYTIDFIELEPVPEPVLFGDLPATDKVAFDGQGDIADFIAQHEGKTIYIPAGQWQTAKRIYLRNKKGTQLIGAGMWYSEIFFTAPSDNPNTYSNRGIEATKDSLLVQGLYLNTACRQRYYNQQDSKQVGKAFMGGWGTGSVIRDCWAEHFECGGWIADYSGQGSRDLLVEHCRFRNNYADGLNCSQGSQGHTIRHCSFRNNGDDDMASWSVGKRTADISFSYCTAENNWRASSLGFFGGTAPSAHHLAIYDALESGVRVNADFQGTGFTADAIVDIHDVTILHCGCVSGTKGQTGDFWGNAQGALNIGNTQYYNVPNVHLTDIDITDSRGNAVYVRSSGGRNVSGLALERVTINGAKGFGIYYSGAIGDVTYCDLTISNCAKGEQSAHMPAYIITDCSTPVETVNHDNRQSAAVSHYYDLLGRDLGTELPRGFLMPIIVHPMQQ